VSLISTGDSILELRGAGERGRKGAPFPRLPGSGDRVMKIRIATIGSQPTDAVGNEQLVTVVSKPSMQYEHGAFTPPPSPSHSLSLSLSIPAASVYLDVPSLTSGSDRNTFSPSPRLVLPPASPNMGINFPKFLCLCDECRIVLRSITIGRAERSGDTRETRMEQSGKIKRVLMKSATTVVAAAAAAAFTTYDHGKRVFSLLAPVTAHL